MSGDRGKRSTIGVWVGAALTVLGPIGGLLVSVLLNARAFVGTSAVPVEARAQHVAQGIDGAITATLVGAAVGAFGLLLLLASLLSVRRHRELAARARE